VVVSGEDVEGCAGCAEVIADPSGTVVNVLVVVPVEPGALPVEVVAVVVVGADVVGADVVGADVAGADVVAAEVAGAEVDEMPTGLVEGRVEVLSELSPGPWLPGAPPAPGLVVVDEIGPGAEFPAE
jgi:hypothetical protein